MIVAVYKQYVKAGGTASVSQFLQPSRDRAARANLFDLSFFEYEHLLGYYRGLFGSERVLVLPFEAFARDGRAFVERIGAFTGRPFPERFSPASPTERATTSRSPPSRSQRCDR